MLSDSEKKRMLIGALMVLGVALFLGACNLRDAIDTTARLCGPSEYRVTKFEDTNDEQCTEDDCSLREAVITANLCPGEKTILLDSGTYDLTIAGRDEDAAATGDLDLTDDVTIRGSRSTIDGEAVERIFHVVDPEADVDIGGVILEGGGLPEADDPVAGSAILNDGLLQITNVILRRNFSGAAVGGILENNGSLQMRDTQMTANDATFVLMNRGTAEIFDSQLFENVASSTLRNNSRGDEIASLDLNNVQITNNQAAGLSNIYGGTYSRIRVRDTTIHNNGGEGIINQGPADVRRSTISENACPGFVNQRSTGVEREVIEADLSNVTISGQRRHGPGDGPRRCGALRGAVYNQLGVIKMEHVTVYDNVKVGIRTAHGATTTVANSIVAGNEEAACAGSGETISHPGNVFDDDACNPRGLSVIVTDLDSLRIDALGDNGGPTQTHMLLEGSPAIDAARGLYCADTDQRGVARPVGGGCDSGAYESSFAVTASEPTASPTEAAPMQVNFNADVYTIERGQCTTLRWEVSGASRIQLLGQQVEDIGAEEVCPSETTGYTLLAQNDADEASEYLEIAVTEPTDDGPVMGCTGYNQNGQLICKETCGPNDPGEPCEL